MALVAAGKEPSPGRGPGGQWGEGLEAEGGSTLTPQQPGARWGSDHPVWHPDSPCLGGCEVEYGNLC